MKEHERKEFERLEELRKTIEKSPLTKQIIAQEAAEVLAKRRAAAEAIEVLKKEQTDVIPRLQADLAGKEAKYLKAKAALDVLSGEIQSARAALSSEGNSFDTDIRNQEAILYESADPIIDEGIEFFRAKLVWLRSPGRISRTAVGSERNIFTWTKTVKEETNVDAIKSALLYCQNAIKELEKLKLSPELETERIEALKSGVPKIDEYQEVTGTKPMEKQAPTSIWRSDYQDEQIERLLKKKV